MTRKKDGMMMATIAVKKMEGKTQEEIAQETGICRQTVSSYLRSPEAQAIFSRTEENTLSFVNNALGMLTDDLRVMGDAADVRIRAVRADLLTKIIVGIGGKVIGSGAKVSASLTNNQPLSPKDRQDKIDTLKQLLLSDNNEKIEEIDKK